MEEWLQKFKSAWTNKDLNSVIELFADNVVYFETPFVRLKTKDDILREWQEILYTENIKIDFEIFVENENRSAISWELFYTINNIQRHLKGTYLVTINKEGKCNYFQQTCESEN